MNVIDPMLIRQSQMFGQEANGNRALAPPNSKAGGGQSLPVGLHEKAPSMSHVGMAL